MLVLETYLCSRCRGRVQHKGRRLQRSTRLRYCHGGCPSTFLGPLTGEATSFHHWQVIWLWLPVLPVCTEFSVCTRSSCLSLIDVNYFEELLTSATPRCQHQRCLNRHRRNRHSTLLLPSLMASSKMGLPFGPQRLPRTSFPLYCVSICAQAWAPTVHCGTGVSVSRGQPLRCRPSTTRVGGVIAIRV